MSAFDQKSCSYHENAHVQKDSAALVAEWLLASKQRGRCLEFGAGTGNLTQFLIPQFDHVEATDIAPRMVAEGLKRYPAANWSVCDAWTPHQTPETWDLITSASMLQWSPAPANTLRRWAQLLRPGGRIISGIYIAPSLPELATLLPSASKFHWLSTGDWSQAIREAGLKLLRVEPTSQHYTYPSAHALMRRLHNTGVALTKSPLPIYQMKRLLQEYDRLFACDGGVNATWTTLRIEAIKPYANTP